MCDPVTLSAIGSAASGAVASLGTVNAMTAMKIGTAVLGHAAETERARHTNVRNADARKQIAEARDDKVRQQALKESQEKSALQQSRMDADIEAMELGSRASLSAGEAGVGGAVLGAIQNQYERDRLTTNTTISSDINNLVLQGTFDRKGIESEAQSRLNQYQPVSGPSTLGLMADVGMSVAEGQYLKAKDAVPKPKKIPLK